MRNLYELSKRIASFGKDIAGYPLLFTIINFQNHQDYRGFFQLCKEYLRRTAIFFRTYPGKCVYPFISISNSIISPQANIEEIELVNEMKNSYRKELVTSFLELNALID